jgi:hypothetical protein
MAIRYAVATGNWSNTATWNGGTLPTSADDVFTNNFVVTINQDITVISLSNKATTGVNAGGSFRIASGANRNIVATTITGGTSLLLDFFNYGSILTITANTITSDAGQAISLNNNIAATIIINANLVANSTTTTALVSIIGLPSTSITINGNVTAANSIIFTNPQAVLNLTINGFAQSSALSQCIVNTNNNSTVNITVTKAISINQALAAVVNTAGSLANVIVKEIEQGVLGYVPIQGFVRLSPASGAFYKGVTPAGAVRTLSDPADIAGQVPAESDVRFGVTYQSGSKTGTAYIPAASSVGFGVPVDNTTGTAALTPASVWNAATSSLTTSGSIGERLKNASTVDTTGDQLAALL